MLRIQSHLLPPTTTPPPRSARGVDLSEAITRVCVPAYLRGLRLRVTAQRSSDMNRIAQLGGALRADSEPEARWSACLLSGGDSAIAVLSTSLQPQGL